MPSTVRRSPRKGILLPATLRSIARHFRQTSISHRPSQGSGTLGSIRFDLILGKRAGLQARAERRP